MPKHWSEILQCSCGKRFRSVMDEARHRHNFPLLCKQPEKLYRCTCGGCRKRIAFGKPPWSGIRLERNVGNPCPKCYSCQITYVEVAR